MTRIYTITHKNTKRDVIWILRYQRDFLKVR